MKVLNLDTFEKENRVITIEGVQYPMKEMSVDDFITLNTKIQELETSGKMEMVQTMEFMIENIAISFPTCPRETLRKRSLAELNTIMAFGRGELDAQTESAEGAGVSKKKTATRQK